MVELRAEGEGDVQEVKVVQAPMCRSRSVGEGGVLLSSPVFVLRPCALHIPLNFQGGGCLPPILRKRVEALK